MLARKLVRALAAAGTRSLTVHSGALISAGTAIGTAKAFQRFVSLHEGDGPLPEGSIAADELPRSVEEAYEIQDHAMEVMLERGHSVIGWKVGAASQKAMDSMGLSAPFFGPIFDSDLFRSPSRGRTGHFDLRGAELEYLVQLRDPRARQDGMPHDAASIAQYVTEVSLGIEIVGTRFERGTTVGALGLIADFAGHGALVQAASGRVSLEAYRNELSNEATTLEVNGEVRAEGHPREVMGDPLAAAAAAVNHALEHSVPPPSGWTPLIATGTMLGKVDVAPGDALVGRCPLAECHFELDAL